MLDGMEPTTNLVCGVPLRDLWHEIDNLFLVCLVVNGLQFGDTEMLLPCIWKDTNSLGALNICATSKTLSFSPPVELRRSAAGIEFVVLIVMVFH